MNFGSRSPVLSQRKRLYPSSSPIQASGVNERPTVTFYGIPPAEEDISLDEFETFALERLKVLSILETKQGKELTEKLQELVLQTHLNLSVAENRRKDAISHWVLRLAFSKSEEMRTRLINFESLLFKHRFEKQNIQQIEAFMIDNEFNYSCITEKEKQAYETELQTMFEIQDKYAESLIKDDEQRFRMLQYYKVDWTEVSDLVGKRRVFINKGLAYVPQNELVSIILNRFIANLAKNLAIGSRTLPSVMEDERIALILGKLQNSFLGPDYANQDLAAEDQLTTHTVDDAAQKHFPLCMQECHKKLKKQHHLQYHARVQFRLFLKGCGLTLQHSLEYFRREFCKRAGMSGEEFKKKYAYNIRHSYGKEGKRVSYTPHNCGRIINGAQPMAGQAHGCPFRTLDAMSLKKSIRASSPNISDTEINEVVKYAQKKEYQLACRTLFEKKHTGQRAENVGNHPNSWYEESRAYERNQVSGQTGNDEFKIATTLQT